ncbi:hypothetical protein JZ751_003963 [Albula glossodonta]|uniref:XK-related protein n=1 Tax=Albula glossodonta TaxID=121402 RepID=A0A8T2P8D3_9TELE|nr:hypothetical protein JZ751_003963 [Albula glossodonta]
MLESSAKFTKIRFLLLVAGIILYIVDIGSDIWVAVHFYKDGHYTWFALTLSLVLFSSVVIQTFSYTWFRDDFGTTRTHLIFPHLMQLGMFTRYFQLLKKGVKAIKSNYSPDHREVFAMGTDLSMLRLFESFLESAPQLLLQLYIILNYKQTSITQCESTQPSVAAYVCILNPIINTPSLIIGVIRIFYFGHHMFLL